MSFLQSRVGRAARTGLFTLVLSAAGKLLVVHAVGCLGVLAAIRVRCLGRDDRLVNYVLFVVLAHIALLPTQARGQSHLRDFTQQQKGYCDT